MKLSSKGLVKKLDILAGRIRKHIDNYTCQKCGRKFPEEYTKDGFRKCQGLDAAHILGRRKHSTRWLILNMVSLCCGCHNSWSHNHPHEFREWVIEKIGEQQYNLLLVASRETKIDKRVIYDALLEVAKELEVKGY